MKVLVACEESAKVRSETFPGIAQAMAEQWGVNDEEVSKKNENRGQSSSSRGRI